MRMVAQYLKWAEECRTMAARAATENDKVALKMMAEAWEHAAEQRRRQLEQEPSE